MKQIYVLVLLVFSSIGFSQTFYSENMGTPSGTTQIANHTFQNGEPIVYSGSGDVRATLVSAGYTGASGGGNVFLTSVAGRYFQIDGLNTSSYVSENIQLQFGYITNNEETQLVVEQSTDGENWSAIIFEQNPTTAWHLVTVQGQIASSATLSLRFTQPATAQMRIDDISLSNVSAACTFAIGDHITSCDTSTLALDSYTVSIPFTGGGNATYTVTTTSGVVGGDNPSTVAEGIIEIINVIENTDIVVHISGGDCDITRNVISPECKPVNTLPFYDGFDYEVGSTLGSQQKWMNLNSGDEVIITEGSLSYPGITSTGNSASFAGAGIDPHTSFTTTTEGTVFASMLVNITDLSSMSEGASSYFASLTEQTKTNFRSRLFVKKSGEQYQFGFDIAGNSTDNYDETLRNINEVVLIVIGYDFDENILKLWINPDLGSFTASTPATLTVEPTNPIANLGGFIIRQDSNTSTPSITVDELKIATSVSELLNVRHNQIAGLQIYPNPVSNGILYVSTENNSDKNIQIFDILGKQVFNTLTSSESVNISNLNSGIYIIRITEEGKTATRKLVVQ